MTIPDRQDDKDAVGQLLQLVLDAVVTTFAQANEPLPARQYVTTGMAAVDCDQVTVAGTQLYYGVPGGDPNQPQKCDGPRTCVMTIQIFRKSACNGGPRGTLAPTPEAMTADAMQTSRDGWLLLDSAGNINTGTLNTFYIGDVNLLQPEGEYVGVQLNLTITVP